MRTCATTSIVAFSRRRPQEPDRFPTQSPRKRGNLKKETQPKNKNNVQPITEPADLLVERGLPSNTDAERLVLGAILVDDEKNLPLAAGLLPEDFTIQRHAQVWRAMLHLRANGDRVDRTIVIDVLARQGLLGSDGVSFVVGLDEGLPEIVRLEAYVKILIEKSTLRAIAFESQRLMNEALLQTAAPGELLTQHLVHVQMLSQRLGSAQSIGNTPTLEECGATDVEYIHEPELYRSAVIALTGDSGSGKSTFTNFLAWQAKKAGTPVLILDREQGHSTVKERLDRLGIKDGGDFIYRGGWLRDGVPGPGDPSVVAWVNSCNPKPLLVVDCLSAFQNGDENDAADMRRFMQSCRNLADLGACVVVLHHDGKADSAKDYRGSSDFKASVDQAFHFSNFGPDGRLGLLKLRVYKSRVGFSGDLFYTYQDGEFIRGRGDAPLPASEQFRDLLRMNPNVSSRDFQRLAANQGLGRDRASQWLNEAVLARTVTRVSKVGKGGGYRHSLNGQAL